MRVADKTSCLDGSAGCFRPEQIEVRRKALEAIHSSIKGKYSSLLDPMAGTGSDALLLTEKQTYVNDLDPVCRKLLKKQFEYVSGEDFFGPEGRKNLEVRPDLIYLDFNNWTQHKFHQRYKQSTEWAFEHARKYVILNDTTFFYLRQYGRVARQKVSQLLKTDLNSIEDYESYLQRIGICGWKAIQIEKFYVATPKGNGGAAYVLFENCNP